MPESLRIALAQLDFTLGDVAGNVALMEAAIANARERDADLVVFSELAILGYSPRDLLTRTALLDRQDEALAHLAGLTDDDLGIVVGYAERNDGAGRPLFNAAALCYGGEVQGLVRKRLLPTYDVFDDDRHFERGTDVRTFDFKGVTLGISICEDAWNDPDVWTQPRYAEDPVADLAAAGADVLVSINGSPFHLDKGAFRERLMANHAAEHDRWLVFVNQVGGNDELIYDGHSFVVAPDGDVPCRLPAFEEALSVCDVPVAGGSFDGERDVAPVPEDRAEQARRAIRLGLRDYVHKTGFSDVIVGMSGGIDSTVVACLAAEAFGPDHVLGVAMPTRYTSDASTEDARAVADTLGIDFEVVPIEGPFTAFLDALGPIFDGYEQDTTEENIQARVRGVVLMALSNKFGSLVITPDNKSESAVGYCTLYGDMVGALAPLGDCLKELVYAIAERIDADPVTGEPPIPRRVIEKAPTAELREDQTDADDLPPYPVIDPIVRAYMQDGATAAELAAEHDPEVVERVLTLLHRTEYKRWQEVPVLKVSEQAFGIGWRYPLTASYEAVRRTD